MSQTATLHSLQQRISEMQPLRLGERGLPTLPGLRSLFPGGALRQGASYSVHGSLQLSLSMLSAASTAGSWCGVIGFPGFGAEAASELGIALDRCILIPDPGPDALGFAGLLSEVLSVVLLAAPRSVGVGETERISARLRDHGSALIVAGNWPRTESTLTVTASRWSGLRDGGGLLSNRELTVQSQDRRGTRTHTVSFANGQVVEPSIAVEPDRPSPRMRLVAAP